MPFRILTKIIKSISIPHIILTIILLVGAFFRLYHIYPWLFFGMDQEYEAFLVKNIISLQHLPAIGVNAGDTGLYLGPAFIYFASIPFVLFHGNPLGWAITASLLGIITTFFLYRLGRVWWGKREGYITAFLYGSSFLTTLYDRQFWNPTTIPLLTVLIFYYLTKAIKENNKYILISAALLGFALQSHLQAILIGFVVIGIILKYRQKLRKNYIIGFICIIVAFQLPIIFFDVRHNFTNTRALTKLIISPIKINENIIRTSLTERVSLFTSMTGRALYIAPSVDLFTENGQCTSLTTSRNTHNSAILLAFIAIIWFYYDYIHNKKRSVEFYIITGTIVLTLLSLIIYNRRIYEYYFLYFIPIFYLLVSYILILISKNNKYLPYVSMTLFLLINLRTLLTANMTYSYEDKREAIKFAEKYVENENYSLKAIGECGKYGGYRYLFEYFGKKPGESYMDAYFSWVYGEPKKNIFPKTVVLLFYDTKADSTQMKKITQEENKLKKQKMIATAQFGKIRVLVIKNDKN